MPFSFVDVITLFLILYQPSAYPHQLYTPKITQVPAEWSLGFEKKHNPYWKFNSVIRIFFFLKIISSQEPHELYTPETFSWSSAGVQIWLKSCLTAGVQTLSTGLFPL